MHYFKVEDVSNSANLRQFDSILLSTKKTDAFSKGDQGSSVL